MSYNDFCQQGELEEFELLVTKRAVFTRAKQR